MTGELGRTRRCLAPSRPLRGLLPPSLLASARALQGGVGGGRAAGGGWRLAGGTGGERGAVGVAVPRSVSLAAPQPAFERNVIQPMVENLGERFDGGVRHSRQVVDEVVLELVVDDAGAVDGAVEPWNGDVHDLGAARFHPLERRSNDSSRFL